MLDVYLGLGLAALRLLVQGEGGGTAPETRLGGLGISIDNIAGLAQITS